MPSEEGCQQVLACMERTSLSGWLSVQTRGAQLHTIYV